MEGIAKLIPQAVHFDLQAHKIELHDGEQVMMDFNIEQRDCVENMMRNTCNMALLYPNGEFRAEVENKLAGSRLLAFYTSLTPEQRVSHDPIYGRSWLDVTIGLESFGVVYDPLQGGREVLTGIDNLLSLFEGITAVSSDCDSAEVRGLNNVDLAGLRVSRIKQMCAYLTTPSLRVSCALPTQGGVLNFSDLTLKYAYRLGSGVRKVEKVKLLITTDHVCTRCGDQFSN